MHEQGTCDDLYVSSIVVERYVLCSSYLNLQMKKYNANIVIAAIDHLQ